MRTELEREGNFARTENGAAAYATTESDCLDLFASIGALRHAADDDVISVFIRAYAENPDIAMKILFYARDVRGGLGERKVFRTILHWLADNEPDSVIKNIQNIAEYGRYDDLLCLLDTECKDLVIDLIRDQLDNDKKAMAGHEGISLLAKWLPSVNTSSKETVRQAKQIIAGLRMSEKEYRKTLSALRAYSGILENNLREGDYTFDYAKQPSKALLKYKKAFWRNDEERYSAFLKNVNTGEEQIHTGTLMPYEIIRPVIDASIGRRKALGAEERLSLDMTWNALDAIVEQENALAVVDGSGSMYWDVNPMPEAVAISLGIYFAEHNTGVFHNQFITFSEHPRLVEIKGKDITEKVSYCESFSECANTNVQAVFNLILRTAVKNNLPQGDLPTKLYFITDMEFDYCAENADERIFENAKRKFEEHGYKLPQIVFWNVASRNHQQPVTMNDRGVALVSGTSPAIFRMLKENILTPYTFMMSVLNSERYAGIAA